MQCEKNRDKIEEALKGPSFSVKMHMFPYKSIIQRLRLLVWRPHCVWRMPQISRVNILAI